MYSASLKNKPATSVSRYTRFASVAAFAATLLACVHSREAGKTGRPMIPDVFTAKEVTPSASHVRQKAIENATERLAIAKQATQKDVDSAIATSRLTQQTLDALDQGLSTQALEVKTSRAIADLAAHGLAS